MHLTIEVSYAGFAKFCSYDNVLVGGYVKQINLQWFLFLSVCNIP